ncbi:MAG: polysaccharide lyase family 8 super-sandwich domain-containing protein [Spirosomataceae bacterium]
MQKPQLPGPEAIQKEGLTNFVGAVTNGLYGAVVFDFKSPHDGLEAKKSWFFFDEEYVCLGTDIKSKPDLPVATTINQSLMRSEVSMMQDGTKKIVQKGNRAVENIKWVYHDQVGYIFPQPTTIHLSNQAETGRWSDITDQKNISKELVSEEVFKLWFDHGKKPQNASYQYIVVRLFRSNNLSETSSSNRGIEILSNTADLQAVKNTRLGLTQLAFYKAGEIVVDKDINVKMDSQGMAMLKIQNGQLKALTVADPSRQLGKILLTVSGIYKAKGEHYTTLINEKQNSTLFIIDLPQGVYLGKSVEIKLP